MDDETRQAITKLTERVASLESEVSEANEHVAEVESKLVGLANKTTAEGMTLSTRAHGKLMEVLGRFFGFTEETPDG